MRLILGCRTKDGKKCKFPFKYEGETYTGCPVDPYEASETWCSTKVDQDGNHVEVGQNYGFCIEDCPKHVPKIEKGKSRDK